MSIKNVQVSVTGGLRLLFTFVAVSKLPLGETHYSFAELGRRHHCRDNVAMFLGHNIFGHCIMSVIVEDTLFRQ